MQICVEECHFENVVNYIPNKKESMNRFHPMCELNNENKDFMDFEKKKISFELTHNLF